MSSPQPEIAFRHLVPAGDRSGPAILFLHGFLSSGDNDWPHPRWVQPLLDAGRDVVVADLPGHGRSAPLTDSVHGRTSRIVDALDAVMQATAAPFDIIGYSLGSRIAWTLAASRPERVRRLVLGGLAPHDPFATLDVAAARQLVDGGAVPADPMSAFIANMIISSGQNAHSLLNLIEGLGTEPFAPAREAPSAATLFVAGLDDPMVGDATALECHVPGARTVRIPGDHHGALQSDAFRMHALAFVGPRD